MPKLEMSVSHNLGQAKALEKAKMILGDLRQEFADKISKLSENWNGNLCQFSFAVMGFAVSGTMQVGDKSVVLNGNLPFAAVFFKGTIEDTIRTQAQRRLA